MQLLAVDSLVDSIDIIEFSLQAVWSCFDLPVHCVHDFFSVECCQRYAIAYILEFSY